MEEKEKINNEIESKNESKRENIIGIIIGILLIVVVLGTFAKPFFVGEEETKEPIQTETEEKKFVDEYPEVGKDNVFEIKTIDEIIKILEHGTGLVFLGFPECPWCQAYVTYLNETAKENDLEKVYYFNILNDRKDNTEKYQEIVELLEEYLQYDDEGNKRVYVPAVIAVNNGKIVGFDDETAWDTKGYSDPTDYWTDEEVEDLKDKLKVMIEDSTPTACTDCNK